MDKTFKIKNKIIENNLTENLNCIIVHPEINFHSSSSEKVLKKVNEICNLAKSINLKIKGIKTIKIRKIIPSYLFGKGQVENIKVLLNRKFSKILIINSEVSPIQQRNLEKKLNCKVLDRTALIIEIFGKRAKTKEGKIQVELAALLYQKTRLVRSWTHLERQRGGAGFMGGPGEKQIESDKRQIDKKIIKLKKELKKIELNRNVQRKQRIKSSIPIISLIGYTNAGKSTLFNYLAKENVFVKNQLFATLDTTMRKVSLFNKLYFVLSDTIGFISNLPTQLIVSFQTTLEEINFSDYILHVVDISNSDWENQREIVINILKNILKENYNEKKIIEVWNKTDLLNEENNNYYKNIISRKKNAVLVSSKKCTGKNELLKIILKKIINIKKKSPNFTSPAHSKKIKALL